MFTSVCCFVNFYRDRSKSPRRNNPDYVDGEGHIPGIDELSLVGHPEEPDVQQIFEPSGKFFILLTGVESNLTLQ